MFDHNPTDEQEEIIRWFRRGAGNLLIEARAGAAKTTTVLEGAIQAPEKTVLLCAFNRHSAEDLTTKLKRHPTPGRVLHAQTLHSTGYKIVQHYWKKLQLSEHRTEEIARKVFERAKVPRAFKLIRAVVATCSKVKATLPLAETLDDVIMVGEDFDTLAPEKDLPWEIQATMVLSVLEAAKQYDGTIGYDDMDWLPIANNWDPPGRYRLVIVDESQDTSNSQYLLAKKMVAPPFGRLTFVGDRHQAIYQWRGADRYSMQRIEQDLNPKVLPLTTSFRCAKSVVREAQKLVSDIRSMETAPEGKVSKIIFPEVSLRAQPGDFVLSRLNAPLVPVCIALRRAGLKAFIDAKEDLQRVKGVLKKIERTGTDLYSFEHDVNAWMQKEVATARARGSVARSQRAMDYGMLLGRLAKEAHSMKEVEEILDDLFEGRKSRNAKGEYTQIICATVHRVKGLETNRVFILQDTLPLYQDKPSFSFDFAEEQNIEYVAITRAKRELYWVVGLPESPFSSSSDSK